MIASYWYSPLAVYLWQVAAHSCVAAFVLGAWSRHLALPSGRERRWILCVVLVLPLLTALVPGRTSFDFRDQTAWLDTARILSIPLLGGARILHVWLGIAALTAVATFWQEVVPVFRGHHASYDDVPASLIRRVRSLPNWQNCRVGITPEDDIVIATAGRPVAPRLFVSRGALGHLSDDEMQAVLLHENAHWRGGRWLLTHFLFLVRFLQCYNPVALWTFREYLNEIEVDCDADAVAARDPRLLARGLLKVYQSTSHRDVWARSTLRYRMEILLGKVARADGMLPKESVAAATVILAALLPWIV